MKFPVFISLLVGAAGLWIAVAPAKRSGRRGPRSKSITHRTHGSERSTQAVILIATSVLLAVLGGLAAGAITGVPALGVVAAGVLGVVPTALLRRSRRRSDMAIRDAWPVAVDELVAYIRSGESLPGAIAAVSEHGPEPLRVRFAAVAAGYRRQGDFPSSLKALVADSSDLAGARIASALSLAHRVGGRELIRVLKALGELIREDQLVRKEIAARQSWTVSGARAAAAAPWVILALFATRSSTLDAFRSPAGNLLIAVGALTTIAGYRAMLFMGRIKATGGI